MSFFQFHADAVTAFINHNGAFPFASFWTAFVSLLLIIIVALEIVNFARGNKQHFSGLALLVGICGVCVLIGQLVFTPASDGFGNEQSMMLVQTSFILGIIAAIATTGLYIFEKIQGDDMSQPLNITIPPKSDDHLLEMTQSLQKLIRLLENQHIKTGSNDQRPDDGLVHEAITHLSQQIYDLTLVVQKELQKTRYTLQNSAHENAPWGFNRELSFEQPNNQSIPTQQFHASKLMSPANQAQIPAESQLATVHQTATMPNSTALPAGKHSFIPGSMQANPFIKTDSNNAADSSPELTSEPEVFNVNAHTSPAIEKPVDGEQLEPSNNIRGENTQARVTGTDTANENSTNQPYLSENKVHTDADDHSHADSQVMDPLNSAEEQAHRQNLDQNLDDPHPSSVTPIKSNSEQRSHAFSRHFKSLNQLG